MYPYKPEEIEPKWQGYWETHHTFRTPSDVTPDTKHYVLPQLPYPSGSGLHVGHAEVYTACDIYARFQRMNGKKVLQVIGWDSFGLPAENYAIKTNIHPKQSTNSAIDNFRKQIKSLGISVDWEREVGSHNPDYYQFTQWFFLLMYRQGLAYRKKQAVNWCDSCKTVLANEQVTATGHCERCDTVVLQKDMEQWYLKITDYAEKLLEGLDRIDWPEQTKERQRNWIGKSEGAEIVFDVSLPHTAITVFTTRPDTLFGATYLVIAPEHALLAHEQLPITNREEVQAYIEATKKKTELERQTQKEKTGVELKGVTAIHPVTGETLPIWVADYVLATYGTGAIMAVPAHDERDFEFANAYGLPCQYVVAPYVVLTGECAPQEGKLTSKKQVVSAFVRNPKTDEYIVLDWGDRKGFVGGGIESGERVEDAILREIKEETGYVDVSIVETVIPFLYGHGYKPRKDSNCFDLDTVFLVDVHDVTKREKHEGDTDEHTVLWVKKDQVSSMVTLDHHCFMWKWFLDNKSTCIVDNGLLIHSQFLDGLSIKEAKQTMIDWLEANEKGKRKIQYKLRDWSVSRQRFWGAPIPMLRHKDTGELQPVPETDLPVLLPEDVDFKPTGQSPLTYSETFQQGVEETYGKGWQREVDTLDTFMCSSWYYYRYLDPKNNKEFASADSLKTWMPVDFYLGGEEHVNGHLLYARFFTKVLFDAGYITFDEPFLKHRHQGLILGEDSRKMSKRWGNVINPTDVVTAYGADTCRMYEMFMGPLEETKPWNDQSVKGVRRFLDRVWRLFVNEENGNMSSRIGDSATAEQEALMHMVIKKVTKDTGTLQFNTAIASMMETLNTMYKWETIPFSCVRSFVLLLSPYAPHMAEELWQKIGEKESIACASWPVYDETKLVADTMTIAVQVNGKLRDTLVVASTLSQQDIEQQARESLLVQKWLDGKEPKKIIYVPGKLVSIVV